MKTPPAHVLARLDDIIVGQEEAKDGGGTPPRHVLLQNCDDDDDADPTARDRSAVVAPDPAHDPTATSSKFWGVTWDKRDRRWKASYHDAEGKSRFIGYFGTQEAAAHAVNAAIRRAGLEGKRKTNPVVDGQLVPRAYKRRRDEPAAATPSTRARHR